MSAISKLNLRFEILQNLANMDFVKTNFSDLPIKLIEVSKNIKSDKICFVPTIEKSLTVEWFKALEKSQTETISKRSIKALCWDPGIALTPQFLNELASRKSSIGRSALKGLTFSLMSEWGASYTSDVRQFLCNLFVEKQISYLAQIEPFVLQNEGPSRIAKQVVGELSTIQGSIEKSLGISATSSKYADKIRYLVIESGFEKALSNKSQEREWIYKCILNEANKEQIFLFLEKVVPLMSISKNEMSQNDLKRFVLFHPNFGDPRLPGFEGNWPKNSNVTNTVTEWLSQSDIKFFFELFISDKSDEQGRKDFWLDYAHLVKGTRVIVSWEDKQKLKRQIAEAENKIGSSKLFAELRGSESATAFMMDFGSVVIVEFSRKNNACYIYESASSTFEYCKREKFWNTNSFETSVLKKQKKDLNDQKLSHHNNWEDKFRWILARYGIRAKGRSR